ncbi:MAG: 16S rRNA (guanine(527)-N(7))-methyltransferase RsmG [Vicinamibacteria bacterium]
MPSANDASTSSSLPPDLEPDYRKLERAVSGWVKPEALSLLRQYGRLVHDSSASLALISGGDRATIYTRHVLDSLNPIALFGKPPASALDVGSGAGFPGIPLAIVWRDTTVILLESREKKAGFLERAVRELGLGNVRVICARLENDAGDWRAGAVVDSVFIRAVGDLPHLLGHAARRARPEATWIYFRGAGTDEGSAISSLAAGGIAARAVPGAFGGRLLTGRFADR